MKKEQFIIKNSAGLKLKGELVNYQPGREVVTLVHGFGGFMKEPQFLFLKKYFVWHGYAVCAFDFTNSLGRSQRDFSSIRYETFQEELRLVFNWLKSRGVKHTFAVGHSMGGGLLLEYLANDNKSSHFISKAALINPFLSGSRPQADLDKRHKWVIRNGEKFFVLKRWFKKLKVPYEYFNRLKSYDLMPLAIQVSSPVLFIVGNLDKTTLAGYSEEFADQLMVEKRIVKYDNFGHTFFHKSAVKLLPEISLEIYKWFYSHE